MHLEQAGTVDDGLQLGRHARLHALRQRGLFVGSAWLGSRKTVDAGRPARKDRP